MVELEPKHWPGALPERPYRILAKGGGVLMPVGYIERFPEEFKNTLPCDGSRYDPEEWPELDLILRSRRRRWKVLRWRFGPLVDTWPFGEHRLPDLTGGTR